MSLLNDPNHYNATAHTALRFASLDHDIRCAVAIVGGGLTGLWTAYGLAERGVTSVVLEAGRLGRGGSGRNGGGFVTGFIPTPREMQAYVGEVGAQSLWQAMLDAKRRVRAMAETDVTGCDYRPGQVMAAVRPAHLPVIRAYYEGWSVIHGYGEAELLDAAAMRPRVATDSILGGLYDHGGGHLDPLKLLYALTRAATATGRVQVFEDSEVTVVTSDPQTGSAAVAAMTSRATVRADWLVLACDQAVARLSPDQAGWTLPVLSSIVVTEPLGESRGQALIPSGAGVTDLQYMLNHYHLTADHRLLFGGDAHAGVRARAAIIRSQRARLLTVFPQLADVAIADAWMGSIPMTRLQLPRIVRAAPRVVGVHGYSGQGLVLTALVGDALAAMIAEPSAGGVGDAPFTLLERLPHKPFPGRGRLDAVMRSAGLLWYRWQDRM